MRRRSSGPKAPKEAKGDKLEFDGVKTFRRMAAADAALANSLAGTLDKYNNNTLCP